MPDMRDAIAQYLMYTGGRMPQGGFPGYNPGAADPGTIGPAPPMPQGGGQRWQVPQPGIPSNLQGYPRLPSGQFLPTPISDTGPFPNIPGTQQVPPSTDPNMQPTNAPPPAYPQLDEFGNAPGLPPNVPGPSPGQDIGGMGTPPVNTPMQAPADPFGGMDPQEWYRTYWGNMGR